MITYSIGSLQVFLREMAQNLRCDLLDSPAQEVGEWQSQPTSIPTMELQHVILQIPIEDGYSISSRAKLLGANMPWAEDHFRERVSGQPLNPPPSEAWWPYAQQGNTAHKSGEEFSHTYPERMWPKHAGSICRKCEFHPIESLKNHVHAHHRGIRFNYGDLGDVVNQLRANPMTRQAYLPIWFPEDTGAVHGQRVPCTLGYHLLYRYGRLDITYFIRSCDFIRHFSDDIYMAMRLCQWVAEALEGVRAGNLIMHIGSLHAFEPDRYGMEQEKIRVDIEAMAHLMGSL